MIKEKPPYQKLCHLILKDGTECDGMLYHFNDKYYSHMGNKDRWRVAKHNWINTSDVKSWRLA